MPFFVFCLWFVIVLVFWVGSSSETILLYFLYTNYTYKTRRTILLLYSHIPIVFY